MKRVYCQKQEIINKYEKNNKKFCYKKQQSKQKIKNVFFNVVCVNCQPIAAFYHAILPLTEVLA